MGAIEHLPETLIELPQTKHIRSVFIPMGSGRIWQPVDFDVELHPGERIVSIETIQPNSAIGYGTRVWIEH